MKISFGSNYTIQQKKRTPERALTQLYSLESKGVDIKQEYTPYDEVAKTGVFSTYHVSSPDDMDKAIETILISNGIDFHKTSIKESLEIDNIKSRIQLGYWEKNTHSLVEIDVEKFNELFKKDGNSYIEPEGGNGIGKRYTGVKEYLKTGRPIDASLVYVNDFCVMPRASISDGRHRFAVFRDMGIKKLPVAMDEESIKNAKKFGLI